MYKYILFDLDGTISDPKVGICTSVQYALSKYGIEINDINTLTPFIGPPLRDSFRDFYNIKEEDIEQCILYYRERFSTIGLFENELYDGIEDLLKRLKADGRMIAIASSKPRVYVEKILDYFNIHQYFDVVMGSELDGSREKKIEVIEEVFKRLFTGREIDKRECVMVGDRRFDVEAAIKADIPNIGVAYGYGSKEELKNAKADYIADTVEKLSNRLFFV